MTAAPTDRALPERARKDWLSKFWRFELQFTSKPAEKACLNQLEKADARARWSSPFKLPPDFAPLLANARAYQFISIHIYSYVAIFVHICRYLLIFVHIYSYVDIFVDIRGYFVIFIDICAYLFPFIHLFICFDIYLFIFFICGVLC
jgi:hypothetical protein